MRHRSIPSSLSLLFLVTVLCSCGTTLPQHSPNPGWSEDSLPTQTGLAFGRFQPDIVAPGMVGGSRLNLAEIELRHERTGQRYHHSFHHSGRFYWELPGGFYQITQIWMGFLSLNFNKDHGIRFHVKPGKIIYLGTLAFRSPTGDQIGGLDILNEFTQEKDHLYERYQALATNTSPLEGLMYVLPPKEKGKVSFDIIVKNNLMKPFLFNGGTALSSITK